MKHWLILLSCLLTTATMDGLRAQSLPWVRSGGGPNPDFGVANAYDAQGNLYVTGYFNSPQFNLGASSVVQIGAAPNLFVAKYDANGTLVWLKSAHAENSSGTGIQPASIAVDGAGNAYIAGIFDGRGVFGNQNIQAADVADAFVVKITANGNFEWAFRAGSSGQGDAAASVSWANGALYVAGYFAGTMQYGLQTLPAVPGSSDVFVARHDAAGNIAWVRTFGATGADQATAVAAGQGGDLYVAGYFSNGTLNLAGTEGNIAVANQGNRDGFVARLRASDGLAFWALGFGGLNPDQATAVSVQGTAVYVGGIVQGAGTFVSAGGAPVSYQSFANSEDGFVARYDVNGGLDWVQLIGGSDIDRVRALSGDGSGGVFAAGSFRGTVQASSSSGANSATSNGVDDIFVARYNSLGYVSGSLRTYGGANSDNARGLASHSGRLALIGSFRSTQIVVEGVTLNNNSLSGLSEDVLIAVREINVPVCDLTQITPTLQQGSVEFVQCVPRTTLSVNTQGATNFVVRWFRNGVQLDATGTNIVVNQSGSYQARLISTAVGNCQSNLSAAINVTLPAPTFSVSVSPASPTIEIGQSVTLTANVSADAGVQVSYMWSDGSTTPSITVSPSVTTTYTVNVMGTNGCTASATATVVVFDPGQVSVSIAAQGPPCTGVTLAATTQPVGLPVEWQLNGVTVGSGNTIVASQVGNYTATVAGGAVSNSIGIIAAPTIDAGPDQTINQFSSVTLTASFTGGFADNILWSNAATGGFVGVGASITVAPSVTTTYVATINNGICNPVSDAVTVFVNPLDEPFVFTQNGNIVLDGRIIVSSLETVNISFVAVNIVPSGTYTWTNAAGQVVGTAATYTHTAGFYEYGGNNVTTFNLTVAATDGQSYTRTVRVIIRPDIEDPAGTSVCLGTCAPARTITGRGGLNLAPYNLSYQWLPLEGANISDGGRTIVACPTVSTSYSITVTDNETGASTTETFRVNVIDESFNPLISSSGTVICPGESITLTVADAGSSFRWFYNGIIIPNASASTITVNQPGTYSVQIVNDNGSGLNCASGESNSITLVKRDFLPVPPLTPYGNISIASCTQEVVTLATDDFGAGVAYRWIKDGVLIPNANERTYTVTPESGSGFYQVEIFVPECPNIPPKRSSVSAHIFSCPLWLRKCRMRRSRDAKTRWSK
ncbi:MAG: hypothetical protein NZ534_00445 [Bacteroidia bacterium]|nr:hypothetical protein [Bacteroidia bacterium]